MSIVHNVYDKRPASDWLKTVQNNFIIFDIVKYLENTNKSKISMFKKILDK